MQNKIQLIKSEIVAVTYHEYPVTAFFSQKIIRLPVITLPALPYRLIIFTSKCIKIAINGFQLIVIPHNADCKHTVTTVLIAVDRQHTANAVLHNTLLHPKLQLSEIFRSSETDLYRVLPDTAGPRCLTVMYSI